MLNYPKISIVIPSFNKVRYIGETLQSIVDQKYPNLEVIIMDGGSTDGTLSIIKKYSKKYPKIFSYVSKKDKGQADAINKGLNRTTGQILSYINADDRYEDYALLKIGSFFVKHPNTIWIAGRGRVINEKGVEIARIVTMFKNLLLLLNSFSLLLVVNYLIQPSIFFQKKAFEKYGPFPGTGRVVMEYGLWLRLGRNKMPLVIGNNLSSFRLMKTGFSLKSFKVILEADNSIAKKFIKNPLVYHIHRFINFLRTFLFAR